MRRNSRVMSWRERAPSSLSAIISCTVSLTFLPKARAWASSLAEKWSSNTICGILKVRSLRRPREPTTPGPPSVVDGMSVSTPFFSSMEMVSTVWPLTGKRPISFSRP